MKLRLTRRALGDLDRIRDYLHEKSPAGALRVAESIEAGFQLIVAHPQAGRRLRYEVRRLTLPRFPYLIFYKVDLAKEVVVVVTIRHAARRPILR